MLNILDTANSTLCDGILVPNELFNLVHTIINVIKIAVPILLIIFGMIDFAKSVIAKSEDDVKKYRKNFVSRLISAVVVFLLIFIVQLAVNMIASVEETTNENGQTISDIWSCSKKFINGVESKSNNNTSNTNNNTSSTNNNSNTNVNSSNSNSSSGSTGGNVSSNSNN